MRKKMKEKLTFAKMFWITLIILLVFRIWFLIPQVNNVDESFIVYDLLTSAETRRLDFNITVTKYKQIFSDDEFKVVLETGDRRYRYDTRDFVRNNEKWITFIHPPDFNFGVLLPNHDFTEFAIIFDEKKHHFDRSDNSEYIIYTMNNNVNPRELLDKLIDENDYNK